MNVEFDTVDPKATMDTTTGAHPNIKVVTKKNHVFDANLQKQLLLVYDLESKIKQQEWAKYIADKKTLMILVYGNATTQR